MARKKKNPSRAAKGPSENFAQAGKRRSPEDSRSVSNVQAPILHLDAALSEPIDRACADDAMWFAANPHARQRMRRLIEGEFGFDLGPQVAWVSVLRLGCGLRVRTPLLPPSLEDRAFSVIDADPPIAARALGWRN